MSTGPVRVRLVANVDEYVHAVSKIVQTMERLLEDPRFRRMVGVPRRGPHHPENLPVDGVAYHQRRRARRRRSRR